MSAQLPSWDDLSAGKDCPFCQPYQASNPFSLKIADLGVSSLYLSRNQTYRGCCLLVFNARHATGLEKLSAGEYNRLMNDLRRSALAVSETARPDHMNYATLGNVIPHLHFHIIPRYKNDPRWEAPIWTSALEDMEHKTLPENELSDLAAQILKNIKEPGENA